MRMPTYEELVEWVTVLEQNADNLTTRLATHRQKQAEKELVQSKKKMEQLYSELVMAREMERKRIAGELHDDLGQSLALLKLQLSGLQKNPPGSHKQLQRNVSAIMDYVDQIIENARRVSHNLTPSLLEDLGLSGALRALVDDFAAHSGKGVSLEMTNIDALFPPMASISIYRIFQEILTNIERHAQAGQVTITVKKNRYSVTFQIRDDGKGFDQIKSDKGGIRESGLGLQTLNERVKMLGGRMVITSQPSLGTHINFILPFKTGKVHHEHISRCARC